MDWLSCHRQCTVQSLSLYINYSCVSTCLSVTEGQRKRFDLETQDAVSLAADSKRLELGDFCACQPLHSLQTQTLAPWMEYTKTREQEALIFSVLQIAKELDSREDIVTSRRYIVNSEFSSSLMRETARELTSFLDSGLI